MASNKLLAGLKGILLPFFIPGHLASRLTLSVCLGLSAVGILNIAFFVLINSTVSRHIDVNFGDFRNWIWFAATAYLVVLQMISLSFGKKRLNVAKSANSESSARISRRRAA